jgi:hypothetical protein
MDVACSKHYMENAYRVLVRKPEESVHFRNLGTD